MKITRTKMTVQEYLEKIFIFTGVNEENIGVEINDSDRRLEIVLDVPEDQASLFIGTRGETLYSLQHLIRIVFKDDYPDKRIVLDVNGYRQDKKDDLVEKALLLAEEVKKTGYERIMRRLNSYERYLIHDAISNEEGMEDVTTESFDEGTGRSLMIRLKDDAQLDQPIMDEENYE